MALKKARPNACIWRIQRIGQRSAPTISVSIGDSEREICNNPVHAPVGPSNFHRSSLQELYVINNTGYTFAIYLQSPGCRFRFKP